MKRPWRILRLCSESSNSHVTCCILLDVLEFVHVGDCPTHFYAGFAKDKLFSVHKKTGGNRLDQNKTRPTGLESATFLTNN